MAIGPTLCAIRFPTVAPGDASKRWEKGCRGVSSPILPSPSAPTTPASSGCWRGNDDACARCAPPDGEAALLLARPERTAGRPA